MSKRYLAAAAVTAAVMLVPAPFTPAAAVSSAVSADGTHPLKLRGGLTLHLPSGWKAYRKGDWIRVVTGKCASPTFMFGTSGCDSFWVLGPEAIKVGYELGPYTGEEPYNPGTGVELCPQNDAYYQHLHNAKVIARRQVGPGHKADYMEWWATCATSKGKPKLSYTQREWFLPRTGVLVVDQWSTRGLSGVLARATWS